MRLSTAVLALAAFSSQAIAKPSTAVVDACVRTESTARHVRYTPIETGAFHVTEDGEAGKTDTTLRHGKDTIGTWEVQKPPAFGLLFNGKETSLAHVIRLDRSQAPVPFSPYLAMWGIVRDGQTSYVCITFNFDGLGRSGTFQNVRGLYLIERKTTSRNIFYAIGNISGSKISSAATSESQ